MGSLSTAPGNGGTSIMAAPGYGMAMWSVQSADPVDTRALGHLLGQVARPGTVVALNGPLGAGKTCFAQGVGAGLDLEEPVVSPTFVLIVEYEAPRPLLHADAYRLRPEEVEEVGLEEALEHWDGLALVEWASRIPEAMPLDHVVVTFHLTEPGRTLEISATGPRSSADVAAWREAWELR